MRTTTKYYAGFQAPAITDEKLQAYGLLTFDSPEVQDKFNQLLQLAQAWWELPESVTLSKLIHAGTRREIRPLDVEIRQTLYDLIPWRSDLIAMQKLFATIPGGPQGEHYTAAHHLLWLAIELDNDREPLTLQD